MAFGDLGHVGLQHFIDTNRFTSELCVFVHIPKTAGSSFSTELEKLRPPYTNIHRQYHGVDVVTFSRIEDELDRVTGQDSFAAGNSCSGHFSWTQAEPIRTARPDARFVTFLRDPIKRVISDYRYARTPTHPTYKQFIARYPDIESYVESPESQDKMARFLLPAKERARAEIEQFLNREYAFIGLLEMYPMSFNILSRLLGKDQMPVEHKRKTVQTADNAVNENDSLHEMIAEYNPRDKMLYDIVRRKLVTVRDDWRALRPAVTRAAVAGKST